MEKTILSHSEAESQALARRLGARAFPGAVLALWGDMGAGKTAFVHGLCQGMGLSDRVSSPTFALVHEHDGPIPLYHFDLYRLSDEDELESVGVEEYWYGRGVSAIEWPSRRAACCLWSGWMWPSPSPAGEPHLYPEPAGRAL